MYIKLGGTTSELSLRLSQKETADAISLVGFYSTFLTLNIKEYTILKYGTQDIIMDKGQYSLNSLVQSLSHIQNLNIQATDRVVISNILEQIVRIGSKQHNSEIRRKCQRR